MIENRVCPYLGKPCIMDKCMAFKWKKEGEIMICKALNATYTL